MTVAIDAACRSNAGGGGKAVRVVLLIAPYFVPSNLAGVHRIRLLAAHLSDFGWKPIVITVRTDGYEETIDSDLAKLLPDDLAVIRVAPIPAAICRRFGLGDMSLRAFAALKREVRRHLERGVGDALFVSVLPGYTSFIGAWAKRRFDVPFVLDFQDPWSSDWGGRQPAWSKAGISNALAAQAERRVLPWVDALTAVSSGTLDGLRKRALIPENVPVQVIPIGIDPGDHEIARRFGKAAIVRHAAIRRFVYLGTINDEMLRSVETLFRALKVHRDEGGGAARAAFIGTSARPDGSDRFDLAGRANAAGVGDLVTIRPGTVPYLDALRTMQEADALLLLGSTVRHYTPSKLFPYWLAEKPILALVHRDSTAVDILGDLGGSRVVTFEDDAGPAGSVRAMADGIREIAAGGVAALTPRRPARFEPFSARHVAMQYAGLFDRAVSSRSIEAPCR